MPSSFHGHAVEPTSSVHSQTPAPARRGIARPSASFAVPRLKPLTQLGPDSGPTSIREAAKMLGSLSMTKSTTEPNSFHQSEHSRRGSTTAHTPLNPPSRPSPVPHPALSTSSASLPNLTLGARVRDSNPDLAPQHNPHPYDVIEPGQEQPRLPGPAHKSRTMSSVAHSIAGSRSGSMTSHMSIGARRFTQTSSGLVQRSGTISSIGTANQAAAVHARRFSTIAREPSSAVSARHISQRLNEASNDALKAIHDDHGLSKAQKTAKSDTRILLSSLSALLGHDGGGDAVGRFVKYVFDNGLMNVKDDFLGLIEKVLQNVPSLQAAYLTVHLHEILEQLQRLGGMILAHPEISAMFSDIQGIFITFMSSPQSSTGDTSYMTIFRNIFEKLTTNSVYRSAYLTFLDRVCQFILASEGVRDGLWSRLSESLFGPPDLTEQHKVRHISEFLSLLFASVEQLTGSPIKPLVKSFIGWIAVLDDLLTKVAKDTRDFLAKPSPIHVNDYLTHPLGYVYSPSDTNSKLEMVLEIWEKGLFDTSVHKEGFARFKKNFDNMILGIQGNSTFARFSRDLKRVWDGILGDPSLGISGTGVEGTLECLKTVISELVVIPLTNVELHDEMVDVVFSDLNLSVLDVLPSEFGFNAHSAFHPRDSSFRTYTSFHLKDLQLMAKSVAYTYSKKSQPNATQTGTLDMKFVLDVTISLSPKDKKLLHMLSYLPFYEGAKVIVNSADVKFYPTNNDSSDTVWSTLEKHLVERVQIGVTNWIDGHFSSWLPTKALVVESPPSKRLVSQIPPIPHEQSPVLPSSAFETHGSARDRFKASIRNMTGLRTGSVLPHLQNPLSGPGSPTRSPGLDCESMDVKRKRRQSMADHLTDISKADSTLPENIQRPPVAGSRQGTEHILPNVFDDDEDELPSEYETMARSLSVCAERDTTSVEAILRPVVSKKADLISVLSHRGGMPLFPSVEIPYEAYQIAEESMVDYENTVGGSIGQQEITSMAQCLSELTSRDTTTHEAIEHPPTTDNVSEKEQQQHFLGISQNMSMDKVTRHLSGLPDREGEIAMTRDSGHFKLIRSGSPIQGLSEQVVMADLLTDKITADNTLPENQATGDLAGPVAALGVPTRPGLTRLSTKEVIPMSKTLSKDAQVDTTLLENIVCPPGHHPQVRHPSSFNGSNRGSFSALKNLQAMSSTLDENIQMDFTTPEGQLKMYKIYENERKEGQVGQNNEGSSVVVGFTDQELKQRRQSFKLTDGAMRDSTTLESIRKPHIATTNVGGIDELEKESELNVLNRERERKKSMNAGQSL